jgi:hypothetical protein
LEEQHEAKGDDSQQLKKQCEKGGKMGVTDLPGPPSVQKTNNKLDNLKRCAQSYTCDQMSRDDTQISYLEIQEEHNNDNLRLVQMLAR